MTTTGRAPPAWPPSTESSVGPVPELYRIHEAPELIDPVLIVGLDGWIDAKLLAFQPAGSPPPT